MLGRGEGAKVGAAGRDGAGLARDLDGAAGGAAKPVLRPGPAWTPCENLGGDAGVAAGSSILRSSPRGMSASRRKAPTEAEGCVPLTVELRGVLNSSVRMVLGAAAERSGESLIFLVPAEGGTRSPVRVMGSWSSPVKARTGLAVSPVRRGKYAVVRAGWDGWVSTRLPDGLVERPAPRGSAPAGGSIPGLAAAGASLRFRGMGAEASAVTGAVP
jgi:hypothetical protein